MEDLVTWIYCFVYVEGVSCCGRRDADESRTGWTRTLFLEEEEDSIDYLLKVRKIIGLERRNLKQ